MAIEIPGSAEDYYKEVELPDGNISYTANRERIRAVVAIINKEIQYVIASGGNAHTASLDISDQFNEFISRAPVLAQIELSEKYAEEMHAAASDLNDKTDRVNREIVERENSAHAIGQWIGAGLLLIFILMMFGILK